MGVKKTGSFLETITKRQVITTFADFGKSSVVLKKGKGWITEIVGVNFH